ncbi:MAG TPA: hypothetical protein VKA60_26625 [Blastocatellia bacterium]|nr:hypothetical protein [Blastocatellia bacterium]
MKFTKPINREVEIDGQNFIVSFDDSGIEFRLKGKRKTARVAWSQVLDSARGEDGTDAHTVLGLGAQKPARIAQNEDALASTLNPPAPQSQPDGSAQAPPATAASATDSPDEQGGEQGRAVSASDIGPES